MATSYVSYALGLSSLDLERKDGSVLKCRVASSTRVGDGIAVELVAGVPRDMIAQLKKSRIAAASNEVVRDPLRYDMDELTGLSVWSADDAVVGTVASGFDTRANGMIELKTVAGASIVLSVVPEVIRRVDWLSACVVLMPGVPLDGAVDSDEDDGALA
jgi:ribosomal 30S subunit maturation factor RimM